MLWIIDCTDKPHAAALRSEYLAAHREYLATVNHQIFFSGRQDTDDGAGVLGTVFIVSAPDRAGAEAFIHGESFYRAGVFQSVSIRRVRKRRVHPEVADAPDE